MEEKKINNLAELTEACDNYTSPGCLKRLLTEKYGNARLPNFINLKPFTRQDDKFLKDSVINTKTWVIYKLDKDKDEYYEQRNPGFFNDTGYYLDLYNNLQQKIEPASEFAIQGGRRRHKRTQIKAKLSKKRINKNKRRTRSRK